MNVFESFVSSLDFIDHNKVAVFLTPPHSIEQMLSGVLAYKGYLIIKVKEGSEKSLEFLKPNTYVVSRPSNEAHRYSVWVSYLEEEERWFKTLEEWERILEDLEFGENDADKVETIIVVSLFPKLAENISIEEVAKFYNCKECLHISIGICPLSYKVYEATQKIPEELWKTELYHFIPGCQGMFIEIGHHDLFC